MHALLVTWVMAAAPLKVAVMPLQAGEGLSEKTAAAITDAMVGELRLRPQLSIITSDELQSVLTLERQQTLLGCSEKACMVELSAAMGVEQLITGSVSKLGLSWLIHLKRLDASSAAGLVQSNRRLKGKTIDEVLDELPAMVAELFDGAVHAPPPSLAPPTEQVSSPGGVDEPWELGELRKKLVVLVDPQGNVLALVPFGGSEAPFLAGEGLNLWAQRVVGGSRNGDESFSLTFWDPRMGDGWKRSLTFQEGRYKLQCGEKEIAYQPAPPPLAKKVLGQGKFFRPRWRRALQAVARDDAGVYYVVDAPLSPEGSGSSLRLFLGPKGKLHQRALSEVLDDAGGQLLISSDGKLRLSADEKVAEWLQGAAKTTLVRLPVDGRTGQLVYRDLGVYREEALRTACDPHR